MGMQSQEIATAIAVVPLALVRQGGTKKTTLLLVERRGKPSTWAWWVLKRHAYAAEAATTSLVRNQSLNCVGREALFAPTPTDGRAVPRKPPSCSTCHRLDYPKDVAPPTGQPSPTWNTCHVWVSAEGLNHLSRQPAAACRKVIQDMATNL